MKTRIATLAIIIALLFIVDPTTSLHPRVDAQSNHPPPTSSIQARDGKLSGHSVVSWAMVPDATYYRVGYINRLDYEALLLANPNADWRQTVIFTELAARDLVHYNNRTEFTVQHLEPGVQHFFTVLTSNDANWDSETVYGTFVWPTVTPWIVHIAPATASTIPAGDPPTPDTTTVPTAEPEPTLRPTAVSGQ